MMNSIKLSLNKVENQPIVKDGISFSNMFYIDAIVDGKSLFSLKEFEDAFIVYEELINCDSERDKYLIFTCACGIADDGGWEGVFITKNDSEIKWAIPINDSTIHFNFDLSEYQSALTALKKEIENIDFKFLEPKHVVFPEEW